MPYVSESRTVETAPKRGGEAEAHAAVESWDNEGGNPEAPRGAGITPSDVSLRAREQAAQGDELAAMRASFLADFANGSIGRRHNTFRHRSRILRQLTEEMRIRNAAELP